MEVEEGGDGECRWRRVEGGVELTGLIGGGVGKGNDVVVTVCLVKWRYQYR